MVLSMRGSVGAMKKTSGIIKEGRVQVLTTVKLCKWFALLVPAQGHYFFVDAVPLADPLCAVGWKSTLIGEPDATIKSYPVEPPRSSDRP